MSVTVPLQAFISWARGQGMEGRAERALDLIAKFHAWHTPAAIADRKFRDDKDQAKHAQRMREARRGHAK